MTAVESRPGTAAARYIADTRDCLETDLHQVGGKSVGLGRLLRAEQNVPRSFVVTASAYRDYIQASLGGDDPSGGGGHMPVELREEIESAYRQLAGGRPDPIVAVRSSATIEDSTEASCAGQFETILGVSGPLDLVAAVERCFVSAFEPHVDAYRSERNIGGGDDGVAVIVQELVDARASGVMFTRHPRTGDRSLVVIESSYGLGEAVVGGEITPDLFEVNKVTGEVHERRLGSKWREHRMAAGGSIELRSVETDRREDWSISDSELADLVEVARHLERTLGKGLDIEWAIGTRAGSGDAEETFVLQVRPITVDPNSKLSNRSGEAPGANSIERVLGRLSGQGHLGATP